MKEDVYKTIESLYYDNYNKLFVLAQTHLRDSHRAEEIVQEAFEVGLLKYEKLLESENPGGWLYKTMMNLIKHEFRARKYILRLQEELTKDLSDDSCSNLSDDTGSTEILSVLSRSELRLLTMIYTEGYSIKDAAAELKIGFETCRKRVHRARKKLIESAGHDAGIL